MELSKAEKLEFIASQVGYKNSKRYIHRAEYIFKDLDLEGKHVLDVGCGCGAFALWAGVHGAKHVLGIEPENAGSTSGTLNTFRSIITKFNLEERVQASGLFLQDVPVPDQRYDIIVLFNVINHLNEEAVEYLHQSEKSVNIYLCVLQHLRNLMNQGGYLILADSGRSNFWPLIGMKSPVAKSIEWHKHQNPKTWTNIIEKADFTLHDLRWSTLNPLGRLSANRLIQYLTTSHFVLRFRAGGS